MERKMAMVVNHIKPEDEDCLDVAFWLSKSVKERIAEVARLRVEYYTLLNGFYPEKMERVIPSRNLL